VAEVFKGLKEFRGLKCPYSGLTRQEVLEARKEYEKGANGESLSWSASVIEAVRDQE
jgi:hypothetical protein